MKRFFDIFFSITLILLLSPILFLICIVVFIDLGNPILFKQKRPGLNEKVFTMYKFRTMSDELEKSDAQRLTIIGRTLRSLSLDELPELWNVLIGDMSFVGPRPLLVEYLDLYDDFQKKRHMVKPGITGWAQINGRNQLSWEDKFLLDIWYVENQSFLLDLKILLITVKKVLLREGISGKNSVTMESFKGKKS